MWNHSEVWRHSVGSSKKACHITLSGQDEHGRGDHWLEKSLLAWLMSGVALSTASQLVLKTGKEGSMDLHIEVIPALSLFGGV